ncbi:NB-ARC domain, LRR domain containing protein [Parasponia andersonii]|uniref:NB-ARC domain, LRR domain containing protein n=1 Tax=Parasponia andersonii TaxID=3476 RepID=A0A2P5DGR1_PARAD|nr:NB-ARC domain, LRR domain containing protein [Parasponia andersonii]
MAALPVDYAISKIVSLVESEVSLLGGISEELQEIKLELVSMKSFLEDADQKTIQARSEGEKAWIDNVRDVAFDVEDVIDELIYQLDRPQFQHYSKLANFLHNTILFPKTLWLRHCAGTKLKKLSNRVRAIPERQRRYGVKHIEGNKFCTEKSSSRIHSELSLFVSNEELVGIDDQRNALLEMLMDREVMQLNSISVVGMGGSGKTTLAAQAFNSLTVKQNFDCCAWVCVSRSYAVDDLLKNMIKELNQGTGGLTLIDLSSLSYRQLVEMLVNFLKPLRYFIVLDDVWNVNLWSEIRLALPDNKRGSRILLTTRREDIGSFSFGVKNHVHHIQLLRKDEAWALFCLKAFSNYANNVCPLELESIAKDMVGKCQGLPLAIVALAGLMTTKTLEIEWRKLYSSLCWELSNNPVLERLKSVLMLSFNDLPYPLKRCFLYCCIFPEDCLIRRKRLIRLWMAEGFVEEVRGLTPEEVAESYLMELGYRGMLEVVKNPSGRAKACKMHDLMRELARSISEKEKLCVIYDSQGMLVENRSRRVSIQTYDREIESWRCISGLRSFFVFPTQIGSSSSVFSVPFGFRLLRVLDMEYVPIYNLPSDVGNLFNLRYLNLKGTKIQRLPKSIGRLHNLQTLNLYQTRVKKLPSEITNLRNLRYLISCYYDPELIDSFHYASCTEIASDTTKLQKLQVLHFVKVNGPVIGCLRNLTQLTCMGIAKTREVDETALCSSIEKLNQLCHLSIMASSEDDILHMEALSSAPPYLRRLNLIGKLEKIPHWFQSLYNLKALYLSWSRLPEDPVTCIQSLPNLQRLTLVNAYTGKCLHFPQGFVNLKSLILHNFPSLNEIIIDKGVMQGIQSLWLFKCMAVQTLPHGIEYLTNLQQISLKNVSQVLIESIRGENSWDRPRFRHISKINHYYWSPSGWKCDNLS